MISGCSEEPSWRASIPGIYRIPGVNYYDKSEILCAVHRVYVIILVRVQYYTAREHSGLNRAL